MWRIFRMRGPEKWYHAKDSIGTWVWIELENLMYAEPITFQTRAAAEKYIFEAVAKKPELIGVLRVERVQK